MHVLEAFDLYRFYHASEEETLALRGVSLYVEEGETLVVMGPSGSGKSTLLSCLAGIDEPDGGYVVLMGERLTRRPEAVRAAMRASNMGVVTQDKNLFSHLSVEDNVLLKMKLAGVTDRKRPSELLTLVGIKELSNAYPFQLSGGEAARASIAVAMAAAPKLLIADEPTGEVDAQTEERILALFEMHRRQGGAAVIATHSGILAEHADCVIRLYDGRIHENAENTGRYAECGTDLFRGRQACGSAG